MAEVERDQKTEEATPKRRRESSEKGDVLEYLLTLNKG